MFHPKNKWGSVIFIILIIFIAIAMTLGFVYFKVIPPIAYVICETIYKVTVASFGFFKWLQSEAEKKRLRARARKDLINTHLSYAIDDIAAIRVTVQLYGAGPTETHFNSLSKRFNNFRVIEGVDLTDEDYKTFTEFVTQLFNYVAEDVNNDEALLKHAMSFTRFIDDLKQKYSK